MGVSGDVNMTSYSSEHLNKTTAASPAVVEIAHITDN